MFITFMVMLFDLLSGLLIEPNVIPASDLPSGLMESFGFLYPGGADGCLSRIIFGLYPLFYGVFGGSLYGEIGWIVLYGFGLASSSGCSASHSFLFNSSNFFC